MDSDPSEVWIGWIAISAKYWAYDSAVITSGFETLPSPPFP